MCVHAQALSDSDPHTRYLAACLLLCPLLLTHDDLRTRVYDCLLNPVVYHAWCWPPWLAPPQSPGVGPGASSAVLPPLPSALLSYRAVADACADARAGHQEEDVVLDALGTLRGLVTVQAPAGGRTRGFDIVLSPLSTPDHGPPGLLPDMHLPSSSVVALRGHRFSFGGLSASASAPAVPVWRRSGGTVGGDGDPLGRPLEGEEADAPPKVPLVSHDMASAIFSAFCVFHAHPGADVMLSAVQNIDNSVMLAGNQLLACLLAAYPPGASLCLLFAVCAHRCEAPTLWVVLLSVCLSLSVCMSVSV